MWSRGRESSYMPDMARKRAFRIGRSRTGLGLFATAPIKKGAFIIEYKGRKLTTEQADKLEARGNRYLYEINSAADQQQQCSAGHAGQLQQVGRARSLRPRTVLHVHGKDH
jgi:hypothetical protein